MRLGYLVPEFPGQTHIMFWRELSELKKLCIPVEVVSTRRPRTTGVHAWASAAARETTYLYPPRGSLISGAARALVCAGPSGVARLLRTLREYEGAGTMRGTAHLFGLVVSGASLAGLARRRGWTHVHVHSCGDAANIAVFASTLLGLTYSITLHGGVADYGGNQRQKWQRASFAIVITRALEVEAKELSLASAETVLRIVGMGVDPAVFQRALPYKPWRSGEQARLFSCGRLNQAKGHIDALTALKMVRANGIDAVLVIAGEDEFGGRGYRRTIEQFVTEERLTDSVEILGAVDEERVRRELQLAHIFVLASRAEPLGVAIMEAMAMEVPVVVTGAGGVAELVVDGTSGVLVPPESPEDLALEVIRLLADPERARRLGSEGRRTVLDRFRSARSAEVLVEELRKSEERAQRLQNSRRLLKSLRPSRRFR